MTILFYFNAAVAVLATFLAVTMKNAVHALLCFILSLLSLALAMCFLGAYFAAVLEVIVYAGAIMVLFVFVVMLLGIKPSSSQKHEKERSIKSWLGPVCVSALLGTEIILVLNSIRFLNLNADSVSTKEIAVTLFTNYSVAVELVSFLLLAGLMGAYHVGKRSEKR